MPVSNPAIVTQNNTFTGANAFNSSVQFSGSISPPQITSNQNDYNPTGLSTANRIRLTSDQDGRNITGLAGGLNGLTIIVENVGSFIINLVNQSTSSAANNRFLNHRSTTIALAAGDVCSLTYDSTLNNWLVSSYGDSPSVNSLTAVGAYPGSPVTTDVGYDSVSQTFRACTPIGDAYFPRNFSVQTSSSSAINNTAAKVDFSITTPFPANSLTVGTVIRYKKTYIYSTTTTPTIDMFETIGTATAFVDTGAVTTGLNISNGVIYLDVEGIVTAVGASGSIDWKARIVIEGTLGTLTKDDIFSAATTVDTTGTLILKSSVQWGTANSANTIVQKPYAIAA